MKKAPRPEYPESKLIRKAVFDKYRVHKGDGDMWPVTWAADGELYGGAGDNMGSPMNVWKIGGDTGGCWDVVVELVHRMPVDPEKYCDRPRVDKKMGVKPASILGKDGMLYLIPELHNYGENPEFNRQCNISSWIITSKDWGRSWNLTATGSDFFTGRLASPHIVQFGKDYSGTRDEYIYAIFSAGIDGNSYWCNGDHILLGRVPKDDFLDRKAWEFICALSDANKPSWDRDGSKAQPVFEYYNMTGEDHLSYNKGLERYIMGNFSFIDKKTMKPRPYHQCWPESCCPSQLALFEAPEPWGPWSLFHIDDGWGSYGGYQPCFPAKWISGDGREMYMVSSGSYDDYNFTVQKLTLELS